MKIMHANVFQGLNHYRVREVERPSVGVGDAVIG